jgi:hypothetical protein
MRTGPAYSEYSTGRSIPEIHRIARASRYRTADAPRENAERFRASARR